MSGTRRSVEEVQADIDRLEAAEAALRSTVRAAGPGGYINIPAPVALAFAGWLQTTRSQMQRDVSDPGMIVPILPPTHSNAAIKVADAIVGGGA